MVKSFTVFAASRRVVTHKDVVELTQSAKGALFEEAGGGHVVNRARELEALGPVDFAP